MKREKWQQVHSSEEGTPMTIAVTQTEDKTYRSEGT